MTLIELAFQQWLDLGPTVLMAVGGFTTATLGGLLSYKPARDTIMLRPRANELATHLPFDTIADDGMTIKCRDGTLCRIVALDGLESFMRSEDTRASYFDAKKDMLDQIFRRAPRVELRSYSIRYATYYPPAEASYPNAIVRRLMDLWDTMMSNGYRSRQVILISSSASNALEHIEAATSAIITRLRDQNPTVMSQHDENPANWPAAALARIVSPISRHRPAGTGINLADMIGSDRVGFHRTKPRMRYTNGARTLHARIMTVRTWGEAVDEYMMLQLGRLPSESIITQIMHPLKDGNLLAIRTQLALKRDRTSMVSTNRHGIKDQFNAVIADISGETDTSYTLWDHHTVITFYDTDEARLDRTIKAAEQICGDKFVNLVQEGLAAIATWLHQFPCFPGPWPRQWQHNSLQVACCLPFNSAPPGQRDSDWGRGALLRLPTIGGAIHELQLHVRPPRGGDRVVAHSVIVGGTGRGKSTLVAMLCMASLRFPKHRVFVFDSDRGMEIATYAAGGYQIRFDGNSLRMNPFDDDESPAVKSFQTSWLKKITNTADTEREVLREISDFVNAIYTLPREHRTLRGAANAHFLDDRPNGLKERLQPWIDPTTLQGNLFNATRDRLADLNTRWVTFDFTSLYDNAALAQAVVTYLTHKIRHILTSRNETAIIFIDEAHRILGGDLDMHRWFQQMLRGYRRLGIAVISAFQDTSVIDTLNLGDVIRANAPTGFFMPNPSITNEDCQRWLFTDRETDFMQHGWDMERGILVKRYTATNQQSVILNADFSALRDAEEGNMLSLLASDEDSRAALRLAVDAERAALGPDALRTLPTTELRRRVILRYLTREPANANLPRAKAA